MKNTKKTAILLCQVFIFFLTIVVVICGATRFSLLDQQQYYESIVTEEFDAVILRTAENSLQLNQSIIAFPSEVLFAALDKELLLEDCHRFTGSALHALFTGDAVQTYSSEHTELHDTVYALFASYEQESGLTTGEADKEAVLQLLNGNINAQVNYLPAMLTSAFSKMGGQIKHYGTILSDLFWPALVLLLIVSTVVVMLNRDDFTRAAYKTAVPAWVASSVLFIPTMIVCSYNIAQRLPLKTSGMSFFVRHLVQTAQNAIFTWTLVTFILFTGVLVYGIISHSLVKHRRALRRKNVDNKDKVPV